MKVIFLDVDGVLNSQKFAEKYYEEEGVNIFREDILNRSAIACLKRIVSATGAIIVLSSTWRHIALARQALVSQLDDFGLSIHSDTPHAGGRRGADISAWFARHPEIEVESYVILDDDNDMEEHLPHLIQTDFYGWGLINKHALAAIEMLNGGDRK